MTTHAEGSADLVGRLLAVSDDGHLVIGHDERRLQVLPGHKMPGMSPGSWVRVIGRRDGDRILDARVDILQPARMPPERWSDVALPELRHVLDPSRLHAIKARSRLITHMRSHLDARGFLEVSTPILHDQAEACHVVQLLTTGVNGNRLYLRTDPEEYLKRYLTAGIEAVYEVAANIRGEWVDSTHLQEFTSVEAYRRCWSFSDAQAAVEDLIRDCLIAVNHEPVVHLAARSYNFSGPVAVRPFDDLLAESAGVRPSAFPTTAQLAAVVQDRFGWTGTGTTVDRFRRTWLEWLFDAHAAPSLDQPTFVTEFPVELGLSGRACDAAPTVAWRGELYLPGGLELAHFYENITQPDELRRRYTERRDHRIAAGMAPVPLDGALQHSAELGMPPMSGFAIGIDRLLMVAIGAHDVACGLLFPHEGFASSPPVEVP